MRHWTPLLLSLLLISCDAEDDLGEGGDPLVVEGVPPEPYDGQFLQMDVLEIIEH